MPYNFLKPKNYFPKYRFVVYYVCYFCTPHQHLTVRVTSCITESVLAQMISTPAVIHGIRNHIYVTRSLCLVASVMKDPWIMAMELVFPVVSRNLKVINLPIF